jgi:hypothetical protein
MRARSSRGIEPAGSPDHIAYLVLDPFERGRPVPVDLPLHTQLFINPSPTPWLPRRARHGSIRYDVDCVLRGLTPLQAQSRNELEVFLRSQFQGRAQVNEVCVRWSARQGEVVRVGKQWIERTDCPISASSIA